MPLKHAVPATLLLGVVAGGVAPREALALDCADRAAVSGANDRAQAAFRAEQYAVAADQYAAVHACTKDPSVLFNLAKAQANTGRWLDAKATMTAFLASATVSEDVRQVANEELASIRSHVGAVTVRADVPSAAVSIDGKPVGPAPVGPIDHAEGKAHVEVSAPGRVTYVRDVELQGGGAVEVDAILPEGGATEGARPRPPIWMWIGYGVAGAGGLIAAITGGLSIARVAEIREQCDGDLCPKSTEPDRDAAEVLANVSNASIAIGAAGAIVGVIGTVVWATAKPSGGPSVAVRVGVDRVSIQGSF